MNKINTSDLKQGQMYTEPVFTDGTNMLVPANYPIRQKDINLLVSWGIEAVQTEGVLIDKVEDLFEIPDDFLEAAIASELESKAVAAAAVSDAPAAPAPESHVKLSVKFVNSEVQQNSLPYRAYRNLIGKLDSIFLGLKTGADVEMRMVDNISVQLLQDLHDHPNSFVGFILGAELSGNELAKSSVNTAILAAITAYEMKIPNHKINNIISGALLHDVGMLRLSKGITEKKGGLSEAELEQIKSHPQHSSKIVQKELFGSHEVNLIAMQHHERWDGQGYPDKLAGPAIDIGARIVSVADAFEAMVSKKSYRASLGGYQAIKNLMADNGRRFDPSVIGAFTKIMGIYPIGSIARLNDNSIARVLSIHPEAPMRPVVQLLTNKEGQALNTRNISATDLLAEKTLFIKSALDPTEIENFNG